jgi:hypothetical protein
MPSRAHLDAVTEHAAAPVVAKYTGVLGGADIFRPGSPWRATGLGIGDKRSTVRVGTWSGGLSPLPSRAWAIWGSGQFPSLSFACATASTCTGVSSPSWTWASAVVRKT